MKMKIWSFVLIALCAVGLFAADASVTSVTAKQRYPWNGLVDVDVTFTGDAQRFYNLVLTATDRATGARLPVKTLTSSAGFSVAANCVAAEPGACRLTWDAGKDVRDGYLSDDIVYSVGVAPNADIETSATEISWPYMIVDLSGGTNAVSFPIYYLKDKPTGDWPDRYKTERLVLKRIEPGTFTMGLRSSDYSGASDANVHEVTLTKAFHIGVFEVTQRQYELVMGMNPSADYNKGDTRAACNVSYDMIRGAENGSLYPSFSDVDADSFLGVFRFKTGIGTFDLPTEAQWEYACRAGTTTALNSGENLTSKSNCVNMAEVGRYGCNSGWYYTSSGNVPNTYDGRGGFDHLAIVGSYQPNAWGLYDMHGNVWEWCRDWYGDHTTTAATDPVGASSGSGRVGRGGRWDRDAMYCRSGHRSWGGPSDANHGNGFRLSRTLP